MNYKVSKKQIGDSVQAICLAEKSIKKGDIICTFNGPVFSKSEMIERIESGLERTGDDPLEVGHEVYMDLDYPFYCFNHSCSPNALLTNYSDLIAFKDISPGEEIVYDYSANISISNDWECTFDCECGSSKCRKRIKNLASIPKSTLKEYLSFGGFQDFLLKEVKLFLNDTPTEC